MRRGFFLIFCMLILSVSTELVNALPIFEGVEPVTPFNSSQMSESLNATELADNWDPPASGGLFGDVKGALGILKRLNKFIYAFPSILADFGTPLVWINAFNTIWTVLWLLSVADMISGGKILGA